MNAADRTMNIQRCHKSVRSWRCKIVLAFLATWIIATCGCDKASDARSAGTANAPSGSSPSGSNRGSADNAVAMPPNQDAHDSDPFALVLSKVVSEDGSVRYTLFAEDENRKQLDAAIEAMAASAPPAKEDVAACKALWINAFNANVMRMAADERAKPGFTNVNDVPGFFDQRTIKVSGEDVTLAALRDRLRLTKDPRIHSALVLAAKGSPPLRSEPFSAAAIDQQLDSQSLTWLDDQAENRAARDGLWLSVIFKDFESDFAVEPYTDALGFVRKHSRPNGGIRDFLRSVSNIRVRHREFDWTLNDADE